ncbi:unnamed protein product, partial [marine sediment metagenome]
IKAKRHNIKVKNKVILLKKPLYVSIIKTPKINGTTLTN